MDTEKTLTSFDGALLGALEGDRLGLVVGYKVIRRRRRTYHVSYLWKVCIKVSFLVSSETRRSSSPLLDLFLLTSFDGDPEGESVGYDVVGLDVGCVNK